MNMLLSNTFYKTPLYQLVTGILIMFSCASLNAQVEFKLAKLADGETFCVSLIPQKSWSSPMNITSTAQVTIKVPTNSFEVQDLVSMHADITWEYNSKSIAPTEAAQFDYLSFGLSSMGTKQLEYQEGVEIPLFTFKNAKICQGGIELMSNNDPFKSPNSRRANVGNSITIFGAKGEAYVGNRSQKAIPCQTELALEAEANTLLNTAPVVYPNPAINEVFVDLNWLEAATEGTFIIKDINGRTVGQKAVQLESGFNKVGLNVKDLSGGIFMIEFQHQDQTLVLERFVKQNR